MTATVYDVQIGTDNLVRQVVSTNFSPNIRIEAGRVSAGVDPSEHFVVDGAPTCRVQSMDLAGVLGILSATAGLDLDSDGNIDLPYQFRLGGSTFAGTLAHSIIRGTAGLVIPTSAGVNQGDPGSVIDFMVHYESDGFTDPVSQVDDQTLTAQAFNAMFGLGPAVVDAAALVGVMGHTVNFGISIEPEKTDGAIYPVTHFIVTRNPTIDIRFRDFDSLAAVKPMFEAMTSLAVYHRKRAPGSTYETDVTAAHVSFSFADGIKQITDISGSGNQPAIPTLRCHGEALSVSTTATIP
jgi:hypothetical protein